MGLGPTGWVDGSTDQFTMACDFIIDFNDFMIYMQDFRIVSLGNVNINLRGNPLIDWLSNLIISTVSARNIRFSLITEVWFVVFRSPHFSAVRSLSTSRSASKSSCRRQSTIWTTVASLPRTATWRSSKCSRICFPWRASLGRQCN